MRLQIESDTVKGTFYEINYSNGGGGCTCRAFRFTGWCKHLQRLKEKDKEMARTKRIAEELLLC